MELSRDPVGPKKQSVFTGKVRDSKRNGSSFQFVFNFFCLFTQPRLLVTDTLIEDVLRDDVDDAIPVEVLHCHQHLVEGFLCHLTYLS